MRHRHKCDACDCVWEHDPVGFSLSDNERQHQCPQCGVEQYVKYHGRTPPAFIDGRQAVSAPVAVGSS